MSKMSIDTTLRVTEIQRFCMHDGPGVRTTVFLKGCPLRCAWCHNPETQRSGAELLFYANKCLACGECVQVCPRGVHTICERHTVDRNPCIACGECVKACPTGALQLCGEEMSIEQILSVVQKDRAFYGDLGGITLSGGEPFAQNTATISLLKACRTVGLSTAVETCGFADTDTLLEAAPYTDLFLWDLKDTDSTRHRQYTGVSNEVILKNLMAVNDTFAHIRLRCILVNGINTNKAHYTAIAEIARRIHNLDGVEFIPYHAYGGAKATLLGDEDNGRKEWIPEAEEPKRAQRTLRDLGVTVL